MYNLENICKHLVKCWMKWRGTVQRVDENDTTDGNFNTEREIWKTESRDLVSQYEKCKLTIILTSHFRSRKDLTCKCELQIDSKYEQYQEKETVLELYLIPRVQHTSNRNQEQWLAGKMFKEIMTENALIWKKK